MAEQLTGARAALAQLVAEGVEVVLSVPGIHNLPLCDAVLDHPELRFITGRHEQGITFMANGYSRASGKMAIPLVITGPGVTNSITALADAAADSVPLVLVAAQAQRQALGKGALHELKDQTALLASVTKWNTRVERVEEVPEALQTAFFQAHEGRPGPTVVEIPLDVQRARGWAQILPPSRPRPTGADPGGVRQLAGELAKARMPLLFLGSGTVLAGCTGELLQLTEKLQVPCLTTTLAKGVIPDDHPLNLNWSWADPSLVGSFLRESDLVVVIGSSLDDSSTIGQSLSFPENLIQIDSCCESIGKAYPVKMGLVGDAKEILAQLLEALPSLRNSRGSRQTERTEAVRRRLIRCHQGKPGWEFMKSLQEVLDRDAFVTNDASEVNAWARHSLDRYLPRTFNATRNMATLGYALPAALGAKLAFPHRQAVALVGDGGFLFTVYTLATAVQHRLNAVVVVFNDNCYTTVKRHQKQQYGRSVGADLRNPDIVQLAESFGARGLRAREPEELAAHVVTAKRGRLPTVIEVPWDRPSEAP